MTKFNFCFPNVEIMSSLYVWLILMFGLYDPHECPRIRHWFPPFFPRSSTVTRFRGSVSVFRKSIL